MTVIVAAPLGVGAKGGCMEVIYEPKILSWNVRGLNEGGKRLKVRNLIRQWKADIICLQETKLEFFF
jgi:endonuclease/exonuclease/phosphatase family metal-dependent hydrolase